jgi:lipopolysaccharide export LptBFGC system permease protein LptF
MAVLGIPFSFSMGRKGAFFGITVSILVAMAYWGVFSVFEQLGAYGFLIPPLAAWAANIVFAAAGLALLLLSAPSNFRLVIADCGQITPNPVNPQSTG